MHKERREALKKENEELKQTISALHPPHKLQRNSLGLMTFSTFSYLISTFAGFNLVHPYFSIGLFAFGFSFFIMASALTKDRKDEH